MSYNYCLVCGVSLAPNVNECPICGYDNSFVQHDDLLLINDDLLLIDDEFLNDYNDDFYPEDDLFH